MIDRYFGYQIAKHWMEWSIGETIPFDFVHIIIALMLSTLRSVAVQHKYLWRLFQIYVHHRKLSFFTDRWSIGSVPAFGLLLRRVYSLLKNIKSIRELVMFQDNKWNRSSCLISEVRHRNLCNERTLSVTVEWTKFNRLVIENFILMRFLNFDSPV
jgi:hypothetical protein